MTPYLICSEIDDTLMIKHRLMTARTRQALHQVMAQGHQVYLSTGRMLPLAHQIVTEIGGPIKVIAANGATFEQGDQLENSYLSSEQLTQIYQTVLSNNCRVYFFENNRVYYTGKIVPYQAEIKIAGTHATPKLNAMPLIGPEFLPNLAGHITNAIAYGQPSELTLVRQLLVQTTDLNLSSTNSQNLEIIPPAVNKALALAAIQQYTGIDSKHTLVFGSQLGDLQMFQLAGHSIAMGNANDVVRQAATDITLSNTQDGVAVFLEDFFNLNEASATSN